MRNYKAITKSEGDFVVLTRKDVHAVLLKSSIRWDILSLFNKSMNMIVL